jgi:hypothetical protein
MTWSSGPESTSVSIGLGSKNRGGSEAGRAPSADSYSPKLARRRSPSAKGSVMKSTASGSNAPGAAQKRWPYIPATYRRRLSGVSSSAASASASEPWRTK